MNYHLFQLICRFKLVQRLITLQKAATGGCEVRRRTNRETQITGNRMDYGATSAKL